jgi:hypothetical protein
MPTDPPMLKRATGYDAVRQPAAPGRQSDAELAHVELIGAVRGGEADAARRPDAFVSRAPVTLASAWLAS